MHSPPENNGQNQEIAYLGAGCFWCTEAQFQQLAGVTEVQSGYMGGHKENPTYKEVCTGQTGHAEIARITFDPTIISYREVLAAFWKAHDPTQPNRQGNDVGTQYRSAVFYTNETQKLEAEGFKQQLNVEDAYGKPLVTEITAASAFYPAEDYHTNYFNLHGNETYCMMVVRPKLDKFKKAFAGKLKFNS